MLTIARYEALVAAIVECDNVDRLKPMMDKAEALRVYAKRAGNFEAEGRARLIRLRAEHRAGELLKEAKADGRLAPGRPAENGSTEEPFLESAGITKRQSHDWRAFADIPWAKIELDVRKSKMTTAHSLIKKLAEEGDPEERPTKTIHVHFTSPEAVLDFAKKIGQEVTLATSSIWHPASAKPYRQAYVHFESQEAMDALSEKIGKKITLKTREMNWPLEGDVSPKQSLRAAPSPARLRHRTSRKATGPRKRHP
jgi:hypothetical protein